MAWEATCLLPPVLLVLLASGSWGQKPEMLHLLEGESFSVKCLYPPQKGSEAVKFWCRWDLPRTCTLLATSPQLWGKPQNSIEDKVGRGYFIVTMTELRVEDSGSYSCGIYKSSRKFFQRNIHLVVSRGLEWHLLRPAAKPAQPSGELGTQRTLVSCLVNHQPPKPWLTVHSMSTSGTTAWTSATSPVTDSPQGNWQLIVPSSTLGVLLVLVLILLMILFFRKARRSAAKGEDKSHHIYNNISVQKEPSTGHRKELSPRQRRSQLSWGSDQQKGSDEDTGAICYASLIHLNQFGPEDSIYVNTQPKLKPTPDPFLTVEYACIPGTRPQPTKSTAPDRELKS
ncbi:trem-like transcript 4 protein [Mustela erminea]|uniref:trem-like transcript 4 protein n=1 Tax=Mustela erminea TaxID=36723 RepID=UPI001386813C|nr:trem-like transcript 4 protein [Mustela erminea]